MIPQAVPLIAVEFGFEFCTLLLLDLIVRRQLVIKKREQILLIRLAAGERRQVTWAHVTPAPKGSGKAQVWDDFAQQRQIFAENLILQGHVGGADHQRFVLFPRDGNTGNEI